MDQETRQVFTHIHYYNVACWCSPRQVMYWLEEGGFAYYLEHHDESAN